MINKIKSLSLFYRIYFISLIAFLVILIAGSIILSSVIGEYNKGLAETVSENFFNETFTNLDTEKIIEMSGVTPSEFETKDDIKNYIEKSMSDNLTYTSISSEGDDKKYIVKSGDFKVASFTLSADEKGDYHPKSLELHLSKSSKNVYKVLGNSTLYINGVKVSDSYITERSEHISSSVLPEGVPKLEWVTYTVEGLTATPDIKLLDRNGIETDFSQDNSGVYNENIIYDEQDADIVERVLKGAKQYAICMQEDASKASVFPYFERGTDLYESFRMVENFFVWDHSSYEILDEKVTEFLRYDENTVSMRISFTHVLKKYGHEDYKDITDITYYARNIGGKYMIFARHNNA